jgi:outer membrane receptor for ferrienterochelin and colicin
MHITLRFRLLLVLFLLAFGVNSAFAQKDTLPQKNGKDSLDVYDMTLEQLLNIKAHGVPTELESLVNSLISVASKKPLSTRESPSIVTLVTAEEIRNSGARDLIDVLNLVPGFDFGVDVEGVVGIGTRGNWAHEGKVLLLLDGQEMNEILFATTQFGNHFPVDQIKRIEIIRGPGSAIYGGFAEYGVINIITRSGEDLNGISVGGNYGQMKNDYGSRNVSLMAGKKINDFEFSLGAFAGQGNRSDQVYTDFYGNSYKMAGNSELDPLMMNVGLSYKGLSFRGIYDGYRITVGDGYDHVRPVPYLQTFNSSYTELKYVWKLGSRLSITPRFNYKVQEPWETARLDSIPGVANSSATAYDKRAERYLGNLTASYNITRHINLVAGGEIYRDYCVEKDSGVFASGSIINNGKAVVYTNYAGFFQGLVKHRIVNIIIGARYDKHSLYGDAFVPRVGLTKKIKRFNFKLLYSQSFRAPAIENINTENPALGIHPEKTEVIELETGYELTHKSLLTVNVYDITTKDPIVYYVIGNNTDAYVNYGKSGTKGIEAEYRVRSNWGYITTNYAFYTTVDKEEVPTYSLPDNNRMLLAFPAHKVNLTASINLTKHISINPSLLYRSDRYGYAPNPDSLNGTPILKKYPAQLFFNLFLNCNDLFTKGLNVGLGVYDIFDQQTLYIEPYNGPHAPLPGPSREVMLRIKYDLHFKEKGKE